MNPSQIALALELREEDERQGFVLAAFPVWLEHGKKGVSFSSFVQKLGLAKPDKKNPKTPQKMTKEQLAELYSKAAKIRNSYLETRK